MEDRDELIMRILKQIKCLRKDIREIRKSMDTSTKMIYTNKEVTKLHKNRYPTCVECT